MSIITELMECIETADRSYEDVRNPYNDREILHIPEEELTAIAKRILKANNDAVNKAHADGEKSAMKQARSRSVDYKKGYEQAMKDVERTKDERTKQDGAGSSMFEQGSSITDELRRYAAKIEPVYRGDLERIADRIDEQHSEKLQLAWADGVNHAEGDLKEFKDTHVELPVDADGKTINAGDKITDGVNEHEVWSIVFYKDRVGVEDAYGEFNGWENMHHVQPDSWERIIEDALLESHWDEPNPEDDDYERCKRVRDRVISELVERCKRLVGDAE